MVLLSGRDQFGKRSVREKVGRSIRERLQPLSRGGGERREVIEGVDGLPVNEQLKTQPGVSLWGERSEPSRSADLRPRWRARSERCVAAPKPWAVRELQTETLLLLHALAHLPRRNHSDLLPRAMGDEFDPERRAPFFPKATANLRTLERPPKVEEALSKGGREGRGGLRSAPREQRRSFQGDSMRSGPRAEEALSALDPVWEHELVRLDEVDEGSLAAARDQGEVLSSAHDLPATSRPRERSLAPRERKEQGADEHPLDPSPEALPEERESRHRSPPLKIRGKKKEREL